MTSELWWHLASNVALGVSIVLLAGNLVALWRVKKNQKRIGADQREIEARQREIDSMMKGPITSEMVGIASWREMPVELRPQLREKLVEVLAEIDAEPPPTRH